MGSKQHKFHLYMYFALKDMWVLLTIYLDLVATDTVSRRIVVLSQPTQPGEPHQVGLLVGPVIDATSTAPHML